MRLTHLTLRAVAALAASSLGWAGAQEAPPQAALGAPLEAFELDQLRGGFDVVNNDMQLDSTVSGNSAVNVLSGNNTVADGAFAHASGLPMVIQNSGSNVSIQNATVVNVQLK